MPITVVEKFKSRRRRKGNSGFAELLFNVYGSDDDTALLVAIENHLDAQMGSLESYEGLPLDDIELLDQVGPEHWEASATFRTQTQSLTLEEPDDWSQAFDTSGGTFHISQSLLTTAAHSSQNAHASLAPGYFGGAIGVTGNGVDGIDIQSPVFAYTRTVVKTAAQVTTSYIQMLYRLTAKVNDAAFLMFEKGEVLFAGASANQRADGNWEITYHFLVSENRSVAAGNAIKIGDMENIEKEGWEYVWVKYEEDVDDVDEAIIQRPMHAFVERVYHYGNFGDLQLPA